MKLVFSALFVLVSGVALAGEVQPFKLQNMNSPNQEEIFSSADHPKGVFVIEAYFRACGYCNENAPNVNQLAEDYKDNANVLVLDVGRDTRASDYKMWIEQHQPKHPVLNDGNKELLGPLGVRGYPTTVILNCKLEEKFRSTGVWNGAIKKAIKATIDKILSEDCSVE